MAATIIGTPLAFAGDEPKPLRNFPPGKVRIRIRPTDFVFAFVRDESGIRQFAVSEVDGFWEPGLEMARNLTP